MILLHKEAREELKKGIDKLADAVRATLGPKGRNAVINTRKGPFITKDGVTVAQAIELEGIEKMGAELIREAAMKTNDEVGDGTTTSTILAHSILTLGMKELEKRNPLDIKKEIDERVAEIVKALKKQSKKITKDQIEQVASISANDKKIGKIIADVFKEVGNDGVITAEKGHGFEITTEIVRGMQFDRGTLSPYLSNDIKNPRILLSNTKITSVSELMPIMEKVAESGRKELVIIAEDIVGEALSLLVLNKAKGNLDILAVKAPGFSDIKDDYLGDIAQLTGAKVIDGISTKFEHIKLSDLGTCGAVKIKGKKTTIIDGKGDTTKRAEEIKSLIEKATPYDKIVLRERLGKLSGGVAVIKVGASSEIEAGEIKDRIDDAVNATKHALSDGVVVGAGLALKRLSKGRSIVDRAILEPHKQILKNAGVKNIKIGVEVIDATKVVIASLENAASVASMILTTDVVINNKE